jgi:hypothetical protein
MAKKNVLLVYYSQTGQLENMAHRLIEPLVDDEGIQVDILSVKPKQPYAFPWSFTKFFNIFPETVHLQPADIETPHFERDRYDLVILAYTVWFLSPSQPITAFLQHPNSRPILKNTPVVTLIGCRNMWLMAQEKVKTLLTQAEAHLVDNIVKIDSCGGPASFVATPLWMLTGKKQPVSWLPKAGISEQEMLLCRRFGERIRVSLLDNEAITSPMLTGMSAVYVNERLILSEKFGHRSFYLWGKLLIAAGKISSILRYAILYFYIVFLVTVILTVVPISALIKKTIVAVA